MIIFGAGIVGEALFYACQDKGIKVDSFFDHNPNKKSFMGLPVNHRLENDHYLISVADIGDVLEYLQSASSSDCTGLLRYFDPSRYPFAQPLDYVKYAIDTAITCQENYRNKRFLHSVDLIITERCTLKCRDCSNLMQYYKDPKDCDTAQILKDIDALFSQVDFISEVRVLGGEPFINKDWHTIGRRLIDEPKLQHVVIYTNGTIAPKELDTLPAHKVLVLITDYSELSKNINKLVETLRYYGIPHYVQKVGGWTACSDIIQHNRTPEENQALFKSCCVRNLKTLSNGQLYKCPFEANLTRLGYKFPDACDLCNGRPYGAPEIPPAIQREI